MEKTIDSLLLVSTDTGEEVIEGFKPIEEILEDIASSRVVLYLSYPGGLRVQAAISKYREAVAIKEDEDEVLIDDMPEGEEETPEDILTDEEKSLIYAAYLMS